MAYDARQQTFVVAFAGLMARSGTSVSPIPIATRQFQRSQSLFDAPYLAAISHGNGITWGGSSVEFISGLPRQERMVVRIQANDHRWPEIVEYFLGGAADALTEVATQFDPGDTSLEVESGAGAFWSDYAFASVGRSMYRVTGESSDVLTLAADSWSPTDGVITGGLALASTGGYGHGGTRVFGVSPVSDTDVPPFRDTQVYGRSQFVRGREVWLYRKDSGPVPETLIGRYLVDRVRTEGNGSEIVVECIDMLSVLAESEFNRRPQSYVVTEWPQGLTIFRGPYSPSSIRVGLRKLDTGDGEFNPLWGELDQLTAVLQIGKSVVVTDGWTCGARDALAQFEPPGGRFGSDTIPEVLIGETAFEILVSDPLTGEANHPFYDSATTSILTHPLDLLRAHLGLAGQLPSQWLVDLPPDAIDDSEIRRLRDTIYAGIEWPGILLGVDGEPAKVLETLQKLYLQPLGASLGVDAVGRLTVRSIFDASRAAVDLDSADDLGQRDMTPDFDIVADQVMTSAGIGASGRPRLAVATREAVMREWYPYRSARVQIDAHGLWSPDREVPADVFDLASIRIYRNRILTRLAQYLRNPPKIVNLSFTAAKDVSPGLTYTVELPGLRVGEGGAVDETGEADVIVLRESRTLTTRDVKGYIRSRYGLISASAEVTDQDGDTLTLDSFRFIKPLDGDGEYKAPNAVVEQDVETFAVGQRIALRTKRMVIKALATIDSIDAGNSAFTLADFSTSYTYDPGDIVTLAPYDDAMDPDRATWAWLDRTRYGM